MELRFGFVSGDEKTQKEVADMLRHIPKLHISLRKKDNRKNEKRNYEQNRIVNFRDGSKNKKMY